MRPREGLLLTVLFLAGAALYVWLRRPTEPSSSPAPRPAEAVAAPRETGAPPEDGDAGCIALGSVRLQRDGGLVNTDGRVVVYVEELPTASEPKTRVLAFSGHALVPSLQVAQVGDTLEIENHDAIAHQAFSDEGRFTFFAPSSQDRFVASRQLRYAGVMPVLCGIHKSEWAQVLVLENPYYAWASDGGFSLSVPAGDRWLRVRDTSGATTRLPIFCRAGEVTTVAAVELAEMPQPTSGVGR